MAFRALLSTALVEQPTWFAGCGLFNHPLAVYRIVKLLKLCCGLGGRACKQSCEALAARAVRGVAYLEIGNGIRIKGEDWLICP